MDLTGVAEDAVAGMEPLAECERRGWPYTSAGPFRATSRKRPAVARRSLALPVMNNVSA
jgi:hypothetical protein